MYPDLHCCITELLLVTKDLLDLGSKVNPIRLYGPLQ